MDSLEAKAFAPATVANFGPGFDVLGLALSSETGAPGDTVTARRIPEQEVRIVAISGDGGKLSRDAEKNTAGMAAFALWREFAPDFGVELLIEKAMPLGSGLGSSAASAVAAVVAANALLADADRADDTALLRAAAAGERVASGALIHYDNIAAALLGGLIRVRDAKAVHIERITPLPPWHVVVVLPELTVRTSEARAAIPADVLATATQRLAPAVDELVAAILAGDIERTGAAILRDDVITPYRSRFITGYDRVLAAALSAGAAGAGISGSGPAMFALCSDAITAAQVGEAMVRGFQETGVKAQVFLSLFGAKGAHLI